MQYTSSIMQGKETENIIQFIECGIMRYYLTFVATSIQPRSSRGWQK